MDEEQLVIVAAMCVCTIVAVACAATKMRQRRRWRIRPINRVPVQSKGQYKYFLDMKETDEEMFFKYTRMNTRNFDLLLSKIKNKISTYQRRDAIPAEMKLALTLQYLSQGNTAQKDAWGFQIGHTTAWKIIGDVCGAIVSVLMQEYLPVPTTEDWLEIAKGFNERWNVPNCIGAVDGKHLTIQAPADSGSQFFNYKGHFSVVLMAIVDHDYNFRIVDVGSFGSESDGGIFASTTFGKALLKDSLMQDMGVPPHATIEGIDGRMPYFIIGDDAFPLKINLMKPFAGKNLAEREAIFNYRVSRARRIVENAFGILAARWRIFRSVIQATPERVELLTMTTIILHNFIRKNDKEARYVPFGFVDVEAPDGSIIPGAFRAEITNPVFQPLESFGGRNWRRAAYSVREKLADYFMSIYGQVPWQFSYIRRGRVLS